MKEKDKKIKRFVMDLDLETHNHIRIRSIERNTTMKTWVMRAIQMAIIEEDKRK